MDFIEYGYPVNRWPRLGRVFRSKSGKHWRVWPSSDGVVWFIVAWEASASDAANIL